MEEKKITRSEEMRQHIAACLVSGMCIEEYCKEQNLKASGYYYWRKKLQTDSKVNTGSFKQLQPVLQSSCIEIVFTNGVTIHFENLVPVDYLRQLVH
jgi:transposase-like protein